MASQEAPATYDDSVRAAAFKLSKSFVSAEALRRLQKRNSVTGAAQALAHLSLIAGFGWIQWHCRHANALSLPGALWVSCLLLQSLCMAFLFTAFHELTHQTVFGSRLANECLGHLLGWVIFRPYWHYTFYHYNHHKFTGDPKRDPELQDSFIDLKLDNPVSYLCYLSGVPFWIDRSTTLLRHSLLSWVLPREKAFLTNETRHTVIQEARMYVALYAAVAVTCLLYPATLGSVVWGLWVRPSLIAQPFLRFYLVAEHTGCPQGDNMLSNTRTTTTFWWYRRLAWQMPFHAEHHAFPFIPFHQLPALHDELLKNDSLRAHRQCHPNGDSGYLGVHCELVRRFFVATKKETQS